MTVRNNGTSAMSGAIVAQRAGSSGERAIDPRPSEAAERIVALLRARAKLQQLGQRAEAAAFQSMARSGADVKSEQGPSKELRKPTAFAINVEESWQCRWWAEHFGVTQTQLFAAILKVGVDATAVREELGK